MNEKRRHDKSKIEFFIKGLINKTYTLKQVSIFTGYSVVHLCNLKKQYKLKGAAAFVNGHKGMTPVNKIKDSEKKKIIKIYKDDFEGYNFQFFQRQLKIFYGISRSYKSIYNILSSENILSPKNHKPHKYVPAHLPRPRREQGGDMIQLDATPYEWFAWCGDHKKYALHGAIDDAEEKLTGLSMTENECSYGYYDVLEQTCENFGLPVEVYTDKSAIFCVTPRKKDDLTIQEQLDGLHEKRTQWQRILDELKINQILAHSPQAKGRIERLWGTLQGRLTWYFKKYQIKTLEAANEFLRTKYIPIFNKEFSVKRSTHSVWRKPPENFKKIICSRFKRHADSSGVISLHGYKFLVKAPRCACRDVELCVYKDGLMAYIDNVYYPVELLDEITGGIDETMNDSLKEIIYKYMYSNAKKIC